MLELIKKIPLWCYLLLSGSIIFYTHDLRIAYDMGQYMSWALNIFCGKGYSDLAGNLLFRRGPLFPLMIAGSFWLLDISAWSAFWIVRMFCVLNPMLIYFLGKKLYGKWVGLSAAFLILSSYSMTFWAYRHIDPVWPFFVLLSMCLFFEGLEKNKLYIAFAGVCMGLSYLVKEVAIFLFPFPLLYLLFTNGLTKIHVNKIVLFYASLVLTAFPWIVYLLNHDAFSFAFGKTGYKAIGAFSFDLNVFDRCLNYVKGFISFYSGISNPNSVTRHFMLAPIFVVSWGLFFAKAIKGDKGSILLMCTALCFLPIMCFIGINKLRPGQALFVYYLSYLGIAYLIWTLSDVLFTVKNTIFANDKFFHQRIIFIILIVITIGTQVFLDNDGDRGCKVFLERSYVYQIVKGDTNEREIKGIRGEHNREVGEWIKRNIPRGSRLIADREYPIYFYTGGQYSFFGMPANYSLGLQGKDKRNENNKIIYLRSNKGVIHPHTSISVLFENKFLSYLEANRINYIIVQRRLNYLTLYLDENKSFKKIREFRNGRVKIYKVSGTDRCEKFSTMVTNKLISYLNELKKKDQKELDGYVNKFFKPVVGLDYNDVEKLAKLPEKREIDHFMFVRENRIY